MSDLIEREAVKEALRNRIGESIDECINSIPSANNWIPVSERLPETSGRYLAYIINEYDERYQYIMTAEYDMRWFVDSDTASDNVVAWLPLPKPYKATQ